MLVPGYSSTRACSAKVEPSARSHAVFAKPGWGLLGALLAAVGCSAPTVDDIADASGGRTQGIVLIERVEAADGTTQTNVSAKFMRLSTTADPEAAERVVGSRLDLPAIGECMALRPFESGDEGGLAAVGSIELLDVGDVTLRADQAVMPLAVRAFPDVGDLVSGVFYTSRDATTELPAPATYRIEGSGSTATEPFALEVQAPSTPQGVTIGGVDFSEGVTLEEGAAAPVHWQRARESSEDLVYVDVWSGRPVVDVSAASNGIAVRCAFPDTGEAMIPAFLLSRETLGAMPTTVMMGLHRIRVDAFGASTKVGAPVSIDLGEVRFDLGVVGRMTIASAAAP